MWPLQELLQTGIWHVTHPDRFEGIMNEGLKPEPNIPNTERWKTSRGPKFYPFVRKIGGVSLFDFRKFDPNIYCTTHPMSNWHQFVPHPKDWGGAVWICINQAALGLRFLSADEVVKRWDTTGNYRNTVMPRIECCCTGDIPISCFNSAFITWNKGEEVHNIPLDPFSYHQYQKVHKAWETR
tara:strand:+ start:672 stop:1217 length:546 start_codon:yes stop_codon:yes gene_type:complete